MFISRKSHDLIVETLKQSYEEQIAALKASRDLVVAELRNQIAKLEESRDWYRGEWRRARGKVVARPVEPEQAMPLFEQRSLDADWNDDERALFQDWANDLPKDLNPEEEYRRAFGNTSPLLALTA